MMNRRDFLKKALQLGGLAGLYSLGAGAVEEASALGIFHAHSISSGGAAPWTTWNGTSESGWGDSNVWIVTFVGGLGEDETGVGAGLAPPDDEIVALGAIAAASGSPPSRLLDELGTDNVFQGTAAYWQTFLGNPAKKWAWIAKFENIKTLVGQSYGTLFAAIAGARYLEVEVVVATGVMRIEANQTGAGVSTSTVAAVPASGIVYFFVQADAVHNVRFGFHTSKFSTYDEVPSNQKAEMAISGDFSGATFVASNFFREAAGNTTLLGCKAYWMLMSKGGDLIT